MTRDDIQFELNTRLDIEYAVRDFIDAHRLTGNGVLTNIAIQGDAREVHAHIARLDALRRIMDHLSEDNRTRCLPEISSRMDQFVKRHALIGYATARRVAKAERNAEVLALLSASVSTESVLDQEVFA